ncbi:MULTISPECIES: hypothetical protein [Halorussus]|uniref:hypothetical protein n=1 Tax=Halorussus TaxID=1070314 RepID=UPI0013B40222|nr:MULTISPECIES: hypothetical protein [Halorussus]NHN60026.1 hypothetical protein [Halorussus sp. JP-T4]
MPQEYKPASTSIYVTGTSETERAEHLKASLVHASNRSGETWLRQLDINQAVSSAMNSMETSQPGEVTTLREQGLEDKLNKLRIYHDRAGTDAGLQSLVIETERDDHVRHVIAHDVDSLVDSSAGVDHVNALVTDGGATLHIGTQKIALLAGQRIEGARKRVVTALADSLQPRAAEGENTYQHTGGRPPLGFKAEGGRLVPSDRYDEVCTVLQQVRDSKTSKREAASMLGCVRATVGNALDRPSMYNLR